MNTPRTEGGLGRLDIPLLSDLKQTISKVDKFIILKGVFAKNERGYRLNPIKKRF